MINRSGSGSFACLDNTDVWIRVINIIVPLTICVPYPSHISHLITDLFCVFIEYIFSLMFLRLERGFEGFGGGALRLEPIPSSLPSVAEASTPARPQHGLVRSDPPADGAVLYPPPPAEGGDLFPPPTVSGARVIGVRSEGEAVMYVPPPTQNSAGDGPPEHRFPRY